MALVEKFFPGGVKARNSSQKPMVPFLLQMTCGHSNRNGTDGCADGKGAVQAWLLQTPVIFPFITYCYKASWLLTVIPHLFTILGIKVILAGLSWSLLLVSSEVIYKVAVIWWLEGLNRLCTHIWQIAGWHPGHLSSPLASPVCQLCLPPEDSILAVGEEAQRPLMASAIKSSCIQSTTLQ